MNNLRKINFLLKVNSLNKIVIVTFFLFLMALPKTAKSNLKTYQEKNREDQREKEKIEKEFEVSLIISKEESKAKNELDEVEIKRKGISDKILTLDLQIKKSKDKIKNIKSRYSSSLTESREKYLALNKKRINEYKKINEVNKILDRLKKELSLIEDDNDKEKVKDLESEIEIKEDELKKMETLYLSLKEKFNEELIKYRSEKLKFSDLTKDLKSEIKKLRQKREERNEYVKSKKEMRLELESKRTRYFSILNKKISSKSIKTKKEFKLYKKNKEEALLKKYKDRIKELNDKLILNTSKELDIRKKIDNLKSFFKRCI